MQYSYSCEQINKFSLTINGHLGHQGVLSFCCEQYEIPRMSFCETAEETVKEYKQFHQKIITAGRKLVEENKAADEILKGCLECPKFQKGDFRTNNLIYDINLSVYPAPCQSKCIYCGICRNNELMKFDRKLHKGLYERLFEVLYLMEEEKIIDPEAKWKIASGEITIHPLKTRLLNLVKNRNAMFCTNCFIFDEDIATILENNQHASINLSIDAGTSKTWKAVKGFDNFDTVLGNLEQYKSRSRPGQITLKYIVLPDINDSMEDFHGIIQIMKGLNIQKLYISRDISSKDKQKDRCKAKILEQLLNENKMSAVLGM